MRNILVTGGAGYIGSHMIRLLHAQGFHSVTLDDLSSGHADSVTVGTFVKGNSGDSPLVEKLFQHYAFEGIINFASSIQVGESMSNPALYYQNNLANTITLLNTALRYPLRYFIFSSTAAIFGEPDYTPIDESHPKAPVSVYGRTKLMCEQILADYAVATPSFAYGSLRYFNAAGADPSGELGERHEPETHLIPLLLQVAAGTKPHIQLFGTDYPTPDGTCIRDYIHVNDLCSAHLQLLHYLCNGGTEREFNLGTGRGYSVKEVIAKTEDVTNRKITVHYEARRPGDTAVLVADGSKAQRLLNWQPEHSDLETIIRDAWRWQQKN
jgi:UDP-glucose 4-epimerase